MRNTREIKPVAPTEDSATTGARLLPLAEASNLPIEHIGSKAANLARLIGAGLPVPEGFVIPANFSAPQFRAEVERACALTWPKGLPMLIVRSSAFCEDNYISSAAGLFRSIGGVDSLDALMTAIEQCRAAVFDEHLVEWCRHRDLEPEQMPLALIVQRQVRGDVSGVAMTLDPVSGRNEELVVDATEGSLEYLVQGCITPLTFRIDRLYGHISGAPAEPSLSLMRMLSQSHVLAAMATQAEELFGCAQDIEWLFDSTEGWRIVQSRPVTTYPTDDTKEPKWDVIAGFEGFRRSLAELAGGPLTPLFGSLGLPALQIGYTYAVNEWSNRLVLTEPLFRIINGYLYMRNSFPIRTKLRVASLLPKAIRNLLLYKHSPFEEEARRYDDHVSRLARSDVSRLSEPDLLLLVEQLMAVAGRYYFFLQFSLLFTSYISEALTRWLWKRFVRLKDHTEQTNSLFQGLWSTDSSNQAIPEELLVYLHTCQLLDLDFYHGWSDSIQTYENIDPQALAARLSLEAKLVQRHPVHSKLFMPLLGLAQSKARLREIGLARLGIAWKPARDAAAELGRRMYKRGILDHPDDVFFLTKQDIASGLCAPEKNHQWEALSRYRRKYHADLSLIDAPYYLPQITDPTAKVRLHRLPVAERSRLNSNKVLYGVGVSRGIISGRVLVARSASELRAYDDLDQPVILVTRLVTPGWVPVFSKIAGLITDIGGPLSHSSILIRECGRPAVMGTGDATRRLKTGQLVHVDGTSGIVRIEEN